MVSQLHKDIIVNAIRVLRARRVRPSLKKIAWLVQREHSLSEKTLLTLIEALVESKDIHRVYFKGAISYRIPPPSPGSGGVLLEEEDSYEEASSFENFPSPAPHRDLSSESDADEPSSGLDHRGGGFLGGSSSSVLHRSLKARRGGGFRISKRGGGRGFHLSNASGSAPKPRLHAGPTMRNADGHGGGDLIPSTSSRGGHRSVSDTISHVILTTGGSGEGGSSSHSNSSHASASNGSVTPRSGRSTPGGGSEGDSNDVQCIDFETDRFETPCAPPRAVVRGARRGRPPLSSLGLESRKARPPSARPKKMAASFRKDGGPIDKLLGVERAKRVYDPSEGSVVELSNSPVLSSGEGLHLHQGGASSNGPRHHGGGGMSNGAARSSSSSSISGSGGAAKRRSASAELNGDCSVCDICQSSTGRDQHDDALLRCSSCPATGHPSCLGYSAVLAEKSRRQPWTCMDCKHCTICGMDHLIGTLIFCDECDRAFHLTCHRPSLTTQPQGTWVCCYCRGPSHINSGYDIAMYQSSLNGSGFPLTPRDSPIPPDDESRGSSGGVSWQGGVGSGGMGHDPSIPNATHWTIEEVVAHFDERGFGEEAQVFREQAVDGSAMLLLSRSDVLTSLGLKLGPALKLYRQVRVLQTRLPNPPLLY